MLFKWLWRLDLTPKAKWQEVVCEKYKPNFENSLLIFSKQLFCIWQRIVSLIQLSDLNFKAL